MDREEFKRKQDFQNDLKYFQTFFSMMAEKIQSRMKTKGSGWKTCILPELKERLRTEFKEWQSESIYSGNVSEELIDIANQAMLLWIRINLVIESDALKPINKFNPLDHIKPD